MSNTDATINNIKAQLAARGWEVTETLFDDASPDDCHVECIRGEQRRAWGRLPRVLCWTEAYEKITGQQWQDAITRIDDPAPYVNRLG